MNDSDYFNTALQWAKSKATSSEDVMQELAETAKRCFIEGKALKINKRNASQKILNATWHWPALDDSEGYLSIDKTNGAELAELFVHMVIMKGYALRRHDDHMRNTALQPWWLFDAVVDSSTPEDCENLNGTIKRFDDTFWIRHPIPCGRPFCRCKVIALSEKQALKMKK